MKDRRGASCQVVGAERALLTWRPTVSGVRQLVYGAHGYFANPRALRKMKQVIAAWPKLRPRSCQLMAVWSMAFRQCFEAWS